MAVTNTKQQEELANKTQQTTSTDPYQGMQGVSENTANNLGNYQKGYQQSDAVTAAQQNWQNVQANKPGTYTSKYQPQLDAIMQQIQNPQEFKYEFNGDNLFKNYADLYTQQGRQASADAMGQAAALTGGYGNSYAQNAGNQAFQQYLLRLYDKGMDLRDRAYQQYRDDQNNLINQYNILQGAEDTDYGRYRDEYNDWQTQEQLAANRAMQEREFDYGQYTNALNYWSQMAENENQAYNTNRSFEEQVRQADLDEAYRRENFDWQRETDARDFEEAQRQYNQKVAMSYVNAIVSNGQMPSDELLAIAGLSREDAARMIVQMQAGGGGGGGGGGRSTTSSGDRKYYTTVTGEFFYYDKNGKKVYTDKIPSNTKKENVDMTGYQIGQGTKAIVNNAANTAKNVVNTVKNSDAGKTVTSAVTNTLNWLMGKK